MIRKPASPKKAAARRRGAASAHKDEIFLSLVDGINTLIRQARDNDLGHAARLLTTAKEDMVFWAVSMNFHETPEERFINKHLYGNH